MKDQLFIKKIDFKKCVLTTPWGEEVKDEKGKEFYKAIGIGILKFSDILYPKAKQLTDEGTITINNELELDELVSMVDKKELGFYAYLKPQIKDYILNS